MTTPELAHTLPAVDRGRRIFPASPTAIALGALLVFGLFLRLAELDSVLLNEREARQALSAWRVTQPQPPGAQPTPESPLLFALQATLFSLFGAGEVSARLPVALAGALLPFAPLLLSDVLGRVRSIASCILLAASPVLLLASRQSAAAILTLALTALFLWALLYYARTRQKTHAVLATVLLAMLLLLAEAGGILSALLTGSSLLLALLWTRHSESQRDPLAEARDMLRSWPWSSALPPALLTVLLIATLFALYPGGLAAVGELLAAFVAGFGTPGSQATPLHALQVALAYEPLLLLLATLRLLQLRRHSPGTVDRCLIVWTLLALPALLLWRAATPAHALWLIVPLAGLAAGFLADLYTTPAKSRTVPLWAISLTTAAGFALLALFSLHFQAWARVASQPSPANVHLLWMALALALMATGVWRLALDLGWPVALRNCGAGVLALVLSASLGSGWQAAVSRADDPRELWHVQPAAREARLLRDSLQELARRETGGFPQLTIFAQMSDQSLSAWLLRDFARLRFIEQVSDAAGEAILLLPWSAEPPALAGDYVGQDFVIRRAGGSEGPGPFSVWLPARAEAVAGAERLVLWLRRDIYDGARPGDLTGLATP